VWDESAEGMQGELTRKYNQIPKYVASRTLTELGWQNSQLLRSNVPGAVKKLRDSTLTDAHERTLQPVRVSGRAPLSPPRRVLAQHVADVRDDRVRARVDDDQVVAGEVAALVTAERRQT